MHVCFDEFSLINTKHIRQVFNKQNPMLFVKCLINYWLFLINEKGARKRQSWCGGKSIEKLQT